METSTDKAVSTETIFTEMKCGANLAYLLNDNSHFLTTEYKVLQSQSRGCFLRGVRMMYNGKTELYYMTEGCRAFSVLAPMLGTDRFLTAAGSLLDAVCEVKTNGFLSCGKLDTRLDKIFIDIATYKVRLVYLPVDMPFFADDEAFENELRANLLKVIEKRQDRDVSALQRLSLDLADGTLTLEEMAVRLRGGAVMRESEISGSSVSSGISGAAGSERAAVPGTPSMCLVTMNAPRAELRITKGSFTIGKKVSAVDGAVTFNRMISRVHCRVDKVDTGYTITDLNSANGTFLNQERLSPGQVYPVKNGDVVRLADTDFQVVIR